MDCLSTINPHLTVSDLLVLRNLLDDIETLPTLKLEHSHDDHQNSQSPTGAPYLTDASTKTHDFKPAREAAALRNSLRRAGPRSQCRDFKDIQQLKALNDPKNSEFCPTIFLSWDLHLSTSTIYQVFVHAYARWAMTIVRNDTDVVMVTHLLLYFFTTIPSALLLYRHFTWIHGLLHTIVQVWYAGSYTLMMHQHIHMGGILAKRCAWLDHSFPYITDPLMGHTWNSYYFHHVKHHHVEGNGPDDLSSTIRYQRDSSWHFLQYVTRFFFLAWIDLPCYFLRKGKAVTAMKTALFELANYLLIYVMATKVSFKATQYVFLLPLLAMRVGLMVGNWGQHAFVDDAERTPTFGQASP